MAGRNRFDRLDQTYLSGMVAKAKQGSSNAFAELFASVADRQLWYLTQLFGSRDRALAAMPEVFIDVYEGLPSLTKNDLIMPWLCRISSKVYMEHSGAAAGGGDYGLSRILNLPLAESQIMLMSLIQGLSDDEIAGLMNVGRRTLTKFRRMSGRHLARNAAGNAAGTSGGGAETAGLPGRKAGAKARARIDAAELTTHETSEILDRVFSECGSEANTVPMDTISSYAVYRKERFTLQRAILSLALLVFLMLPLCFLMPGYTVSVDEEGERGLPVYTVEVSSLLPVGRVLASIRDHGLPVYEAGAKEFTVEPTRNGDLDISVELVNRQIVSGSHEVTAVDAEGPVLTGSEKLKDGFLLKVADSGIGVDYRDIYAVDASGETHYPLSASEEEGVLFEYPSETWDIYIPDHIGNTLHLSVKLH